MPAPVASPAQRYLEQLSDSDLELLASASGVRTAQSDESPGYLRGHPELIEPALRSPGAFEQLFPSAAGGGFTVEASPFLLFAVAVHRGVADLGTATFVAEPFAGWRRIPVFDSAALQAHFEDPARRLFAVEHLASYTRVASGPVWVRSERGQLRRVRYSEVDPTRLAALVQLVDDDDKPGIYRRLGDLALLLTGVFPDWAARAPAHPVTVERLVRSVLVSSPTPGFSADDVAPLTGASGLGGILQVLGPHWYRLAAERTPLPPVRRVLQDAADGFEKARRFLTLLTDRYLFPLRGRWFGVSG